MRAVLFALLLYPLVALGQWTHRGEVWSASTVTSWHEHDHGYTNRNYGYGAEYGVTDSSRVVAGGFRNSSRHPSFYLALQTCWLEMRYACLSTTAGLATGYGFPLAVIPTLQVQYGRVGINLFAAHAPEPGWVVGLQTKLRWK